MGKISLEKRLGLSEFKAGELEKAVLEQGKLLAKVAVRVQHLEDHANSVPEAVSAVRMELFENQRVLEWKIDKVLCLLLPEDYPDPGELVIKKPSEELIEEDGNGTEQEDTEAAQAE